MKDPRIATAVAALCEAFNRTATQAMFAAYEMGLEGLPPELVERAARVSLKRHKFMPAPAELREIAVTNGSDYATVSEKAFRAFQRAAGYGPDRSICFNDGAINATIRRLGGWPRVAGLPAAEFDKWLRKDFIEAYTRVIRDGCQPEELAYSPGLNEIRNAGKEGTPLPGGGVYSLAKHGGGEVHAIGVAYAFLLTAPEPVRQISAARGQGLRLELKKVGGQ